MNRTRLCRETVRAALAFHARRLWEGTANEGCFAIGVPMEPHPIFASIMGAAGLEEGLILVRGEKAPVHMQSLFGGRLGDDLFDEIAQVGFSMSPWREIPAPHRRFLREAGFTARRESPAPLFLVKDPGRRPRPIRRAEAEILLYAINGILVTDAQGDLRPTPFASGEDVLTLTVTGDPIRPAVEVSYVTYAGEAAVEVSRLLMAPPELEALPRLESRWLVGLPVLPVAIAGDDRTVRGVVVVDEESAAPLKVHAMAGVNIEEAAEKVFEAFAGDNPAKQRGLPRELHFSSRAFFDALTPALEVVGVKCRYEPHIPLLGDVVRRMAEDVLGGEDGEKETCADPAAIPAPDDLEGWKAADLGLFERITRRIEAERLVTAGALERYFGDAEVGERLLEKFEALSVRISFHEWLATDYRPPGRRGSLVERMKAAPLPEVERELIEARLRGRASFFRVESLRQGESLALLDVVSGEHVVVHDRLLSGSAEVGWCLPGRVFEAGSFHFLQLLGPPVLAFHVNAAVSVLEAEGLVLSSGEPIRDVHLFGRLWHWTEGIRASAPFPAIRNTDGEALVFHTASFKVADEGAVRSVLEARSDVGFDEEEGCYRWSREGGVAGGFGDTTQLGRIEFIGDELVLEVNSAGRLERARAWLEAIPGVSFLSVETRAVDEMRDGPLDDRLNPPEPVPPEVVAETNAHVGRVVRDHYLRWIDEPLPMFGGRTPREMCATAKGRRRVAMVIRTIPAPGGPAGAHLEVPREEMFRALGLEGEGRKRGGSAGEPARE